MNEDINSKINFLKFTIKRNLEAIQEVLSSGEISNYNQEDIIGEINFVKVLIKRNLNTLREDLGNEETSNYNNERNESGKLVVESLRPPNS